MIDLIEYADAINTGWFRENDGEREPAPPQGGVPTTLATTTATCSQGELRSAHRRGEFIGVGDDLQNDAVKCMSHNPQGGSVNIIGQ